MGGVVCGEADDELAVVARKRARAENPPGKDRRRCDRTKHRPRCHLPGFDCSVLRDGDHLRRVRVEVERANGPRVPRERALALERLALPNADLCVFSRRRKHVACAVENNCALTRRGLGLIGDDVAQ
eukprot:Amastigsp_a514953_97.p4 type:complete len:127 gc:universal Amastigsp_a514953_97:386-766(+)